MIQYESKILTFTLLAARLMSINGAVRAANVPAGILLTEKQELIRDNDNEPASLDPYKIESNAEFDLINGMFDGLVTVEQDGSIEPRLASSWRNKGNTTQTFRLRPGITWLDGSIITTQDVVWNWQRLVSLRAASPCASYLGSMHVANTADIAQGNEDPITLGVKALGDTTLEITLAQPMAAFLAMLAHPSPVPLDRVLIGRFGDKQTRPKYSISSGMYRLSQWVVNEHITAGRNLRYWDNRHTVVNKVTYLPINSESASINRYKADEVNIAYDVPVNQFAQLKRTAEDGLHVSPQFSIYYYRLNTTRAPFDNPRMRRALSMALGRDIITQRAVEQGQRITWAISQPEMGGMGLHAPEYASWPLEKRIVGTKKPLAEAGFGSERPPSLNLPHNTFETYRRITIATPLVWKENLGVEAKLQNQGWKTMLGTVYADSSDIVRYAQIADYNDTSSFPNIFCAGDSENTTRCSNSVLDEAMRNATKTTSLEKRGKYYQQAEDFLGEDAPAIPVCHYVRTYFVKPQVEGFTPDNRGNRYTKDMYVKRH